MSEAVDSAGLQEWRRLDAAESMRELQRDAARRRAVEVATVEAAKWGAVPPAELCVIDLLAVLGPLARAAAGLSIFGTDLAATRRRAEAALRNFGEVHRGVSASRLRQILDQVEGNDLVPEMAGGGAPLGRIGAEAMRRVGVEDSASLTGDELETVVGDTARVAADHKVAGVEGAGSATPGSAGASGGSGPEARPFAGLGKETRRTESLRFVASNVCSFGLGVELRGAGAAALGEEEAEPDMGDGCDLLTREDDTLQAALDQLEGGEYAVGVYSETRAVDLDAIDGHVRRRSAGFDCCHTVGVKSVCGVEIGGVTVIWAVSKLLPVRDCADRSKPKSLRVRDLIRH